MEIILKQDIEGLGFKDDLVIVKNGDHSLSSPKYLKILKKELNFLIS